jgi:hypothetical protein
VERLSKEESRKENLGIMLIMGSLWLDQNARVFERLLADR